jgi:hypothetical protein
MKAFSFIIALLFSTLSILLGSAVVSAFGVDPLTSIGVVSFGAVSFYALGKYTSFSPGVSFVTVCGKISKDINKSCTYPLQAGVRDRAVIINFDDLSSKVYGADNFTIEDLLLISGTTAIQIEGKNNSIKPKSMMVSQLYENMFDHQLEIIGFDISPEIKADLNSAKNGRFIVVTENYFKGENGESAFEVYGLTTGLEITVIERDPNDQDTQGAFKITFFTKTNKEPNLPNPLFFTDYATSKAIVDGLL